MDDISPGTKVALRRDQSWTGRTVGRTLNGKAHVKFDGGGTGNFDLADLVLVDGADKTWPPVTETKVVDRRGGSGACAPCERGDHTSHTPRLGGICVGCPCPVVVA